MSISPEQWRAIKQAGVDLAYDMAPVTGEARAFQYADDAAKRLVASARKGNWLRASGHGAEFISEWLGTVPVLGVFAGVGPDLVRFGKKVTKTLDIPAPIFTSPGQKAATEISKETIPANKVRSQLEGRGVNKDEMEWTGFNEWIQSKKGDVPKAEIEEFFQQNQIQVQEVVKGGGEDAAELMSKRVKELEKEYNIKIDVDENPMTGDPDVDIRGTGTEGMSEQEFEDLRWQVHEEVTMIHETPDNTKFGNKDWQLPGGENYRELLLIAPPKNKVPWNKEDVIPMTTEEYLDQNPNGLLPHIADDWWHFNTPGGTEKYPKTNPKATDFLTDDDVPMPPKQEITQEQALEGVLTRQAAPKPRYTGGHFEENDVVAHIRFNERVSPEGKKVLFIEEIQSDWAQKGRQEGFRDDKAVAEFKVYSEEMAAKYGLNPKQNLSMYGTMKSIPADEIAKYEELQKRVYRGTGSEGVPDAPFIEDTNQWTNLSLKRMIRWGSDNGFDEIAWTTGKQQAERYSLEKHIDEIAYFEVSQEGGLYDITSMKNGQKVLSDHLTLEKIESTYGKEIAEKVSKGEGRDREGIRYLEDADLEIGGEGMAGFYDKIVVDQANKIGKKHGAKVEVGNLDSTYGLEEIPGQSGVPPESIKHRLKESKVPVWSMRLTDKLKKASKDGMPYYVALPPTLLAIGAGRNDRNDQPQGLLQ
jgi:hypothetical protein